MNEATAAPLATFEGIGKKFGSTVALDGLSFSVPEGSVCGLLGPNGAGKTTAIRVLLGLTGATAGSTSLLGVTGRGSGFREAVSQTGSLIEGPALYERASARQNIRIHAAAKGMKDADNEINELLELVGLSSRADSRAKGFSLGMKQRLGLAMALLGGPRLVILDEPTNGLDPSGIVEIRELIKRLPERGTTVLVSSHLLSEVELMCDRAAIIKSGVLVAEGSMDEIVDQSGVGGGYRVSMRPDEIAGAQAALAEVGLVTSPRGDASLHVSGPIEDGSQVNTVLVGAGIYVSELRQESIDLEKVFMTLTGGVDGERDDAR